MFCYLEFDLYLSNTSLGFQNVVTIDMLRDAYPLQDMVDHNRRPKDMVRV
jgi:hypothetical protein